MNQYERIRNFLNENDHFAKENGMTLTEITEGHAVALLTTSECHYNGIGIVMGGALFTLTDFAFAGALNSFGHIAVGLNASTSFLRSGKGKAGSVFRAEANLINRTRRTAVFDVNVYDDAGTLLTHSVMTGFIKDDPLFPEK